jgi:hypothetical protein
MILTVDAGFVCRAAKAFRLTVPSLVTRFEVDTQNALLNIQEQFRQLLKKIKFDIALPI